VLLEGVDVPVWRDVAGRAGVVPALAQFEVRALVGAGGLDAAEDFAGVGVDIEGRRRLRGP